MPDREPVVQPDGTSGAAPPKPKLKKLRLAVILAGLGILAVVSTVFGMMMAVASDLPALENQAEYRAAKNSVLVAANDPKLEIAKLTGNQNRILLGEGDISPNIRNAVVAIEDRRFYDHEGVDYKGIARAFAQDLLRRRAAQGGSTITQQFVKNATSAQGNRSVFQKLREAALAYHLERKWTKPKVLTQYLNTVYFGNGAYGVESAVRTYFRNQEDQDEQALVAGQDESEDRELQAPEVTPGEAALLAGMIASPSLYDPIQSPRRARARRDLVLQRMLEQRMITRGEYDQARAEALPTKEDVRPPRPDSDQPYFSSWLTQQLVDRYRPGIVFGGNLRIRTTLDAQLQQAAEQAISSRLTGVGPDASLVAIENKTGEVKAMVGGSSFEEKPFNLATNGRRQPGSSFKPFTLIAALQSGYGPESTFTSQKKFLPVGKKGDKFEVNNYEGNYAGVSSLRSATATSDNSVYAELGLKVGTRKIARLAREMGVRTPISTNAAMTLGGLKEGVTPLEMAYAYSTIANKGVRVSGTLAPNGGGPVAFESVKGPRIDEQNEKRSKRVFSPKVGEVAQQLLAGVVLGGTGKAAQIGEFAAGKTGTTENYGDAWFVGFNNELTVAIWVGYADKLRPMQTEYRGGPVAGGTYPAEVWRAFMTAWMGIRDTRREAAGTDDENEGAPTTVPAVPSVPAPQTAPPAPTGTQPEQAREQPQQRQQPAKPAPQPQRQPQQPQRRPAPQQAPPQPAPQPSPGGGGGANAPG